MSDLRVELSASEPDADGAVLVRLLVVNTGVETVTVDRRLLWGPHPASGTPGMLASEPSTPRAETVVLNAGGVFGRERRYGYDPGESVTFHGYLLKRKTDTLLPTGPANADDLEASGSMTIDF